MQKLVEEKKASDEFLDLIAIRCEAQKIYDFIVFFNAVWDTHDEDEFVGTASTFFCNVVLGYTMLQHTRGKDIRARASESLTTTSSGLLVKHAIMAKLMLAAQVPIIAEEDKMDFAENPELRKAIVSSACHQAKKTLDRLAELYSRCGGAGGKAYLKEYEGTKTEAEEHVWKKLWSLTEEQALKCSDELHPHLKRHMTTVEEMASFWKHVLEVMKNVPKTT
jgi:hypothetical protein